MENNEIFSRPAAANTSRLHFHSCCNTFSHDLHSRHPSSAAALSNQKSSSLLSIWSVVVVAAVAMFIYEFHTFCAHFFDDCLPGLPTCLSTPFLAVRLITTNDSSIFTTTSRTFYFFEHRQKLSVEFLIVGRNVAFTSVHKVH